MALQVMQQAESDRVCYCLTVCCADLRTSSGWGDPNAQHEPPAPHANGPSSSAIAAAPWAAAAGGTPAPSGTGEQ